MPRVELRHIPLKPPSRWAPFRRTLPRLTLGLFVIGIVAVCVEAWRADHLERLRWSQAALLGLAVLTTTISLARRLPAQNVILGSALILLGVGAIECLNAASGVPFGPQVFETRLGPKVFGLLSWPVPFLWLIAIFSCRGVARLVLRPWRHGPNYGWWVIAVAVVLVSLFNLAFEPFAAVLNRYWTWQPTLLPGTWYGAPWVSVLGEAVTTLLILAFVTPVLINKQPGKPPPPDYHPVVVWLLLNLLFLSGYIHHRLWPAATLIAGQTVVASCFMLRALRTKN